MGWHCTSCGARWDDGDGERCPKCLKRTTVEREAPPPPAPVVVEEAPPPPQRYLPLALLPALASAVLMANAAEHPVIAILAAFAFAPIASFLMGGDRATRIYTAIASAIAGTGVVFGAARGTDGPHIALGMIVGALPGVVLFFAQRGLERVPALRVVLTFAAVVATAFVLTTC